MADDCIFCKIIDGKIPSRRVYEDEHVIAFHDVQPQAPVHVLVVPRKHVVSVAAISVDDSSIFQQVFVGAKKVAELLALTTNGFRTVFNTGRHGCQSVFHLHLHVLGGTQLGASMVG